MRMDGKTATWRSDVILSRSACVLGSSAPFCKTKPASRSRHCQKVALPQIGFGECASTEVGAARYAREDDLGLVLRCAAREWSKREGRAAAS